MKHFICLCIGMLMYWNANAQYNIKGYNVAINDSAEFNLQMQQNSD